MKIAICVLACLAACLHALAAVSQIRKRQSSHNDLLMIAGAVIVLGGVVLCLAGSSLDWLVALAGFGLIGAAAILNGKRKQDFHLRHHVVRLSLLALLTIALLFV